MKTNSINMPEASPSHPTDIPRPEKFNVRAKMNSVIENQLKNNLLSNKAAENVRAMKFASAMTYLTANKDRHDKIGEQLKRGTLTDDEAADLYVMHVYDACKILHKNEILYQKK